VPTNRAVIYYCRTDYSNGPATKRLAAGKVRFAMIRSVKAGSPHDPLAGARARVERAYETLGCLDLEIREFLRQGPGSLLFDGDVTGFSNESKAHSDRQVPARFNILAGEVVHHLRSGLDYIVWELVTSQSDAQHSAALEFPIFERKPADKSSQARFDRKLTGVQPRARQLIESLQPYHRSEAILTGPLNDPLMVIHDLDRIDKHRQLTIATCGFAIETSGMAGLHIMLQRYAGRTEQEIARLATTLDPKATLIPQVAFLEFGGRKLQPVVPGLSRLAQYAKTVVELFDRECFCP
jgi:hypothetical protein